MTTGIIRAVTDLPRWPQVRQVLLPILSGLAAAAAWYLAVVKLAISPIILPLPTAIGSTLAANLPLLAEHIQQTLLEAVLGLCISSVAGLLIAIGLGFSATIYRAFYPNLIFFQLIPKVALAPLFIIWLGNGIETRMAFAAFLAFFPIVVSASAGFRAADVNLIRLARSLSASNWQIFYTIRFPSAVPYIFSGLRIGATMTMIGLIVGEFITAQAGLGYITMYAAANLETPLMMGAILLICLIGASLFLFVVGLERIVRHVYGV